MQTSFVKKMPNVFRFSSIASRAFRISVAGGYSLGALGTPAATNASFSTSSSATTSSSSPFHTLEEDKVDLKKLLDGHSGGKAILYFTASWCGPCKAIAPSFSSIAAANSSAKILFVKIDVDDNSSAAEQHAIRAVPTFMALSKGKVIKTFSGANVEALKAAVAELAAIA
jgi:thioredoxin 1